MAKMPIAFSERFTRNEDGTATTNGEIEVLPADDPKKIRLGWIIHEEVGIVIINDYAITNITMTPEVIEDVVPEIIDIDMSHLFDDIENRFGLMEI